MTVRHRFTVRLPVRMSPRRREGVARAASRHRRVMYHLRRTVPPILAADWANAKANAHDVTVGVLSEYAADRGLDDKWVADHLACAHAVLVEMREMRTALSRKVYFGSLRLDDAPERFVRILRHKARHDPGFDVYLRWRQILGDADAQALLGLISSGKGSVDVDVPGLGRLRARGAGPRRVERLELLGLSLQVRGDRVYLVATLCDTRDEPAPEPHATDADPISVVLHPSVMVADSEGSSLRLLEHASAVLRASTDNRRGSRARSKTARKLMDARHNYARQYSAQLASVARERGCAVHVVAVPQGSDDYRSRPGALGLPESAVGVLIRDMRAACQRAGVKFVVTGGRPSDIRVSTCGHPAAAVVARYEAGQLQALCRACAPSFSVVR